MSLQGDHLTDPGGRPSSHMLNASYPGMAHFALTGPPGMTCRNCEHWTGCGLLQSFYPAGGGILKPRACEKYMALMGKPRHAVPHYAAACRHFVLNPHPPPIDNNVT
jgi:hypothetical protein